MREDDLGRRLDVAVVVFEIDKVATDVHSNVGSLAHSAHGLLSHTTALRSRGVRTSRSHLASLEEVVNSLGVVLFAELLDESRKLVGLLFLGVVEEELACIDDALSVGLETDVRDAVGVEIIHGLLDLLMVVAVLFGDIPHALLVHHLVDGEFLGIRVNGSLVNDCVGDCKTRLKDDVR